jgi:MFS family permease
VSARSAWALLLALSLGALIVGIELMVTAVALPQIVAELADWTRLREASWVVNGYLVAYVAVMPLAGRAADRFGLLSLFAASLTVFAVASLLAGAAQSLGWLIGARVVQGLGAGAVVPIATAGASQLFAGPARARALGVVGAATFLGMAAGPFIGAAIIQALDWRWVFYLPAPLALLAAIYAWAAAPRRRAALAERVPLDVVGAGLFTGAVACALVALTAAGEADPTTPLVLGGAALVLLLLAVLRFRHATYPFLELRAFADRTFSGAVLLSLLTGYALATALIGSAVFVDRVRYAGADEQQLALGSLAAAVAVGALGTGFVLARVGVRLPSIVGLALSVAGLLLASTAGPSSGIEILVAGLALFGLGFGVTVTARSSAAAEALGPRHFGVAAAGVTVARMIGMGAGLAALTALGSNRIQALSVVLTDAAARDAVLPVALRGRPLEDYLVVDALEAWAASQAAGILSTLFVIAAVVTAIAIVPTLAMRDRPGELGPANEGNGDGVTDGPASFAI